MSQNKKVGVVCKGSYTVLEGETFQDVPIMKTKENSLRLYL